ncbi:family 20 glycosylhydrolase [Phyllobacterium sp. SYP-B3895]|uniref:family 20 glycosylhydrolase n=1 Tax=Phyllobacterium sp. SYP-B3895 TaxID=2663240 RepID=UPI00156226D3
MQYWGAEPTGTDRYAVGVSYAKIETVDNSLKQGAKLIISPVDRTVFDIKYDAKTPYGIYFSNYLNLERSYGWDPLSAIAPENGKARPLGKDEVLGVEGTISGRHGFEYMTPEERTTSEKYLGYMAFPRIAAIAEIGWSPQASRSWDGFKTRLPYQGERWDADHIEYYKTPEVDWKQPSGLFVINR